MDGLSLGAVSDGVLQLFEGEEGGPDEHDVFLEDTGQELVVAAAGTEGPGIQVGAEGVEQDIAHERDAAAEGDAFRLYQGEYIGQCDGKTSGDAFDFGAGLRITLACGLREARAGEELGSALATGVQGGTRVWRRPCADALLDGPAAAEVF